MPLPTTPEIEAAIVKLCDALCTFERSAGQESVLILKRTGQTFRALNGKPIAADEVSDERLLRLVE